MAETERARWFVGHDQSGHRYLVRLDHKAAWNAWCELRDDDPVAWTVPDGIEAVRIDGAFVSFTDPVLS